MRTNSKIFLTLLVMLLFVFAIPSMTTVKAYSGNTVPFYADTPRAMSMGPSMYTETLDVDAWSGFVINSTAGTYTSASVTIIVPRISCNSTLVETDGYDEQYTVWGVFSDGYNSNDFAGAAVIGECLLFHGTIYSFYNVVSFSSHGSGEAPWSPVAGDKVQLGFKIGGGNYHFSILDETQYRYNYTTLSAAGAVLDSAECVSDMGGNATTTWPTVKFSTVHFTDCKVGGPGFKPTPIGLNPGGGTVSEYVDCNPALTQILSFPVALPSSADFTQNFKVYWDADGP